MSSARINFYEGVVLVDPDAPLEAQKNLFRRNKAIIENEKGSIFSVETWGKRTLANPIQKKKKALYFHYMFQAGPNAIREIERTMNINDQVLRFMHLKLDSRIPLEKHMEKFKRTLQESAQREKDREAKAQSRRQNYQNPDGL
jgi:small subunit ribosomal protein S6